MSAAIEQQKDIFGNSTNGHADSELPLKLELELVIDDRDVIRALCEAGDGEERNQFAIEALKIGVVALRHVGGMVSADVIQRECGKLLRDMQQTFDGNKEIVCDRIQNSLKEYFDPESGRFDERVNRLVSNDGDLTKLITRLLDGENSLLARTLLAHVGRNSPLMQQLDPEHSAGLLALLKKNVEEELSRQREQVLKEFSLDNKQGALARLVNELTATHGDLSKSLQDKIDSVVKELSLNEENSALSRLVRNVSHAQSTITNEFSLDSDTSCLSRLKRELMTVLEAHVKTNGEFQDEVKSTLQELVVRRQEQARSTAHGKTFETCLYDCLFSQSAGRGDVAEFVGDRVGKIANCKKGDILIQLGNDTVASGARIIFEAKEDVKYTITKAIDEIELARKNWTAEVGVFVFSKKSAPDKLAPLTRHGNDVLLVWDSDDSLSDSYLWAALEFARLCCINACRAEELQTSDFEDIEKVICNIEKRAANLEKIRRYAQTAQSSANTIQSATAKILKRVGLDRKALDRNVAVLRKRMDELRASATSS